MGKKTSLQLKRNEIEVKMCDLQSEIHTIAAKINAYKEVLELLRENPGHNNKHKKKPVLKKKAVEEQVVPEGLANV